MKEERLRQHFGQKGEVTDVKIMKTADGRSRLFGFVGYRTEKEAKAAMNYFNNTFLDTSKISVEMARPVGDNQLPRPWSKYSKGSSRYEQKEQKAKEQAEKKEKAQERKRKWKDILEVKEELAQGEDKELLKDFLSSAKSKKSAAATKVWANDLLLPTVEEADDQEEDKKKAVKGPIVKEVKRRKLDQGEVVKEVVLAVPNKKAGGQGQLVQKKHLKFTESDGSDSDEMYEDMPKADGDAAEENESEALPTISVSDLMRLEDEDKNEDGSENEEDEEDEDDESEEEEEKEKKERNQQANGQQKDKKADKKTRKEQDMETEGEEKKSEDSEKKDEQEEEEDDTGRLFVRNLPFSATEDDIYKIFKKHGDIAEVHMPIDRETKKPRGMAFVTFMLPENAAKALTALDGSIFQGRLLHVMPAKAAPVMRPPPDAGDGASFRNKKEQKMKEQSSSSHNWNPFYMKADAVLDAVAANLGVTKEQILNPEDSNMATRVAIAETRIISETKAYLKKEGINLEGITAISAADGKVERSKTMILVKNIPHQTKLEELRDMFSKYGTIARVILPPSRTLALIEYLEPSEARRGFKHLAYTKFHHVPLYLEWAPIAIIGQKPTEEEEDGEEEDEEEKQTTTVVTDKSKLLEAEEAERLEGTTLYIKNLSFKTTEEGLRSMFENVAPVRSVTVAKRKDVKKGGQMISLGYGFVEFVKRDGALKAIKQLQGKQLDGHALQISFAKGGKKADAKENKRKTQKNAQLKPTCTILVKNVAFEASKSEIRDLFATFGQLKSVRMPKKMDGRSRGFAFVDFITKQEAKNAFQQLQDTHLYGRHLVLEFVQNSTAALQEKKVQEEM